MVCGGSDVFSPNPEPPLSTHTDPDPDLCMQTPTQRLVTTSPTSLTGAYNIVESNAFAKFQVRSLVKKMLAARKKFSVWKKYEIFVPLGRRSRPQAQPGLCRSIDQGRQWRLAGSSPFPLESAGPRSVASCGRTATEEGTPIPGPLCQ